MNLVREKVVIQERTETREREKINAEGMEEEYSNTKVFGGGGGNVFVFTIICVIKIKSLSLTISYERGRSNFY